MNDAFNNEFKQNKNLMSPNVNNFKLNNQTVDFVNFNNLYSDTKNKLAK